MINFEKWPIFRKSFFLVSKSARSRDGSKTKSLFVSQKIRVILENLPVYTNEMRNQTYTNFVERSPKVKKVSKMPFFVTAQRRIYKGLVPK